MNVQLNEYRTPGLIPI